MKNQFPLKEKNMKKTKSQKRKIYLINPKFQWMMIRWVAALSVLISAVYFISNFIFFKQLVALGERQNLAPDALYFQFVHQQQMKMGVIFLITTLVAVALIISFGIFSSHKIAGPIHRMCKHLKESDPKKASDVKIREGDFFPELAESYNEFVSKIKPQ